jgi:hypothetical protein
MPVGRLSSAFAVDITGPAWLSSIVGVSMRKGSIIVISTYALAAVVLAFVGLLGVPFTYSGPRAVHPDMTIANWLFWAGISFLVVGFIFVRFSQQPVRRYQVAGILVWSLRAWILAMTIAYFAYAFLSSDHWDAMFFRGQGTGWILIAIVVETGSFYARRRYV